MKRGILAAILLLSCSVLYATDSPQWESASTDVTTAQTFTAKWDTDADGNYDNNYSYKYWLISNIAEATDILYCDFTSDSNGTQHAAVNDGSRLTSHKIPAGTSRKFTLLYPRVTVSCICAAGQTCSGAFVSAGVVP